MFFKDNDESYNKERNYFEKEIHKELDKERIDEERTKSKSNLAFDSVYASSLKFYQNVYDSRAALSLENVNSKKSKSKDTDKKGKRNHDNNDDNNGNKNKNGKRDYEVNGIYQVDYNHIETIDDVDKTSLNSRTKKNDKDDDMNYQTMIGVKREQEEEEEEEQQQQQQKEQKQDEIKEGSGYSYNDDHKYDWNKLRGDDINWKKREKAFRNCCSVAEYSEKDNVFKILATKGTIIQSLGFRYEGQHYLYVEEGLYMMESGRLLCTNKSIRDFYENEKLMDILTYVIYVSLKGKGFIVSRFIKEAILPLQEPILRCPYSLIDANVTNRIRQLQEYIHGHCDRRKDDNIAKAKDGDNVDDNKDTNNTNGDKSKNNDQHKSGYQDKNRSFKQEKANEKEKETKHRKDSCYFLDIPTSMKSRLPFLLYTTKEELQKEPYQPSAYVFLAFANEQIPRPEEMKLYQKYTHERLEQLKIDYIALKERRKQRENRKQKEKGQEDNQAKTGEKEKGKKKEPTEQKEKQEEKEEIAIDMNKTDALIMIINEDLSISIHTLMHSALSTIDIEDEEDDKEMINQASKKKKRKRKN